MFFKKIFLFVCFVFVFVFFDGKSVMPIINQSASKTSVDLLSCARRNRWEWMGR